VSKQTKPTFIRAAFGAILITVLMMPFQALTPFASYSPLLILPILLFFALQAPTKALLGMFLSFASGVGWAALFMLVSAALPGVPFEAKLGVGITFVIFLVLSVHPDLLGRTPLGVLPAVLLGVVLSLLVMLVNPLLQAGAPQLNLLWLVAIFGYGCLMTLVLVLAEHRLLGAVLREDRSGAPADSEQSPRA
jgi:hypothetical protein